MLGTPALFSTAYGNVGSSIYYALGVTAAIALGLTPLVFVISGLIFAATAATYAEGTVRYPEAGGSSSFARHAFNELVSFVAAWAQMLNYIITVAISAFFVPHYLSIFWEPLKTNPWDIIGGAAVIVVLVALNIVGIKEAAKLNIFLAVIDFATQVLLVIIGFAIVFHPHVLTANVHWGIAPTWGNFALAIPVAMIAYTGIETVSNLAEEARDPTRSIPASIRLVAVAVFAIYFTLPLVALSALPVYKDASGEFVTKLGLPPDKGGFGRLDVMMCNAGFGIDGAIDDITPAQMQKLMDVNYFGTYHAARAALPRVPAAGPRPRHHRLVDRRQARRAVHGRVRGDEVRAGRPRRVPARRARRLGHPRQRRVSGLDRHRVLRRDVARDRHAVTRAAGPRQNAEAVADAIARAIERPVPEVYPHVKSRALVWLNAFAPGFCDRLVKRFGRKPLQREGRR